jgi:hypothetical protein
MKFEKGMKVEHEDRRSFGEVVRVLTPTTVVVQWHDGQLLDEHITDLKPVKDKGAANLHGVDQ